MSMTVDFHMMSEKRLTGSSTSLYTAACFVDETCALMKERRKLGKKTRYFWEQTDIQFIVTQGHEFLQNDGCV